MKNILTATFFIVVSLGTTHSLNAQIKKDAAKKTSPKTTEKVVVAFDTLKPTNSKALSNDNTDSQSDATNKTSSDELLESIQRDIKQTSGDNSPEVTPAPPPKPPKIRKPLVPHHHELQLEAGAFLNQAFRVFGLVKDGEPYKASPYVLGYKYKLSTKSMEGAAIRLGLGGFFDRQEETIGNLRDTKQVDTSALSGRLGFEFQRNIGDHFRWLFGADAIVQNNQKRFFADSGVDQVTDKTTGFTKGFGLMMGIRWDFTDRASIGSEMNVQFLNFQGEQTLKFTANPQFDRVIRRVNDTLTYYLGPANVYLSWRF
ncbi:MAG: hypothetical protein U5L45_05235 [Saprospiraceae bacterium]|nr:hypothetical protein [Saprospiraceae bacterium]